METGTYKFIKQPNQYKGKFMFRVKSFAKRHFIFQLKLTGVAMIILGSVMYGQNHNPKIVTAFQEKVIETTKDAPIMELIAKCESSNMHFDKNGQVLVRGNNNKTVDVGRYQINSVWFKKATELKLDVFNEEDNKTMAYWIFYNHGTAPWSSSANCWNK